MALEFKQEYVVIIKKGSFGFESAYDVPANQYLILHEQKATCI